MDTNEREKIRLSDRILSALELAVDQKDLKIAEALIKALEMAMTRNAGGGDFVERRDYPPEIEKAMDKLYDLRDQQEAI